MKNRLVWLDTRVWNTWVGICIGDPKQWKRGLKINGVSAADQAKLYEILAGQNNSGARVAWHDDYPGYVFMQFYDTYKNDPVKLYGSIAHESFHAAKRILTSHGITLVDESEEAFAYLIEHLVRTIHYELRRK